MHAARGRAIKAPLLDRMRCKTIHSAFQQSPQRSDSFTSWTNWLWLVRGFGSLSFWLLFLSWLSVYKCISGVFQEKSCFSPEDHGQAAESVCGSLLHWQAYRFGVTNNVKNLKVFALVKQFVEPQKQRFQMAPCACVNTM